ncbi:MAG: hypothetical protein B7Z47_04605 [Chthoniobacter sp. 12-60-6]|nr:MAG: hypothetical protein B7Z47_04605 [Chthoniobacter sp. 12-60-6]
MTWLLFILCLALSFMLSGLESAVMAVSRVRVRHAASGGDRRARSLLPLIEDRDALIGCITVANHLTNLAAFLLIAFPVIHHGSSAAIPSAPCAASHRSFTSSVWHVPCSASWHAKKHLRFPMYQARHARHAVAMT